MIKAQFPECQACRVIYQRLLKLGIKTAAPIQGDHSFDRHLGYGSIRSILTKIGRKIVKILTRTVGADFEDQ
jgi:hypothetical protein